MARPPKFELLENQSSQPDNTDLATNLKTDQIRHDDLDFILK